MTRRDALRTPSLGGVASGRPRADSALSRVGVNAMFLKPSRGGMGAWAVEHPGELLRAAPDLEIVVYGMPDGIEHLRETVDWASSVRLVVTPVSRRFDRWTRLGAELGWLPARVRHDGIQVLHSLANIGPPVCPVPHVVTIHDLLFSHYPATHPGVSAPLLRFMQPLVARSASAIGTPSEFSKQDIVTTLGVAPQRIRVVHQGHGLETGTVGDPARARAELGLGDRPYVLSIGVGFEHKNVGRLVEAFARVGPQRDAVLVHVGPPKFEGARWAAQARGLGIDQHVRWPSLDGFVADETLQGLLAGATVLAHPSLLEGFGLPPLEAMARGVPVICSRAASLPEVAGDAAEFFDPLDVDDMARALARVLDDAERRAELVRRGHEQVARFSWRRNAEEYLQLYRDVHAHAGKKAP